MSLSDHLPAGTEPEGGQSLPEGLLLALGSRRLGRVERGEVRLALTLRGAVEVALGVGAEALDLGARRGGAAVRQGLLRRQAVGRVDRQQGRDELLGLQGALRQPGGHDRSPVLVPAGQFAGEERVGDDAHGPHVGHAGVAVHPHELRGHVGLGAAPPRHRRVAGLPAGAEAEVDELHRLPVGVGVHHVLQLDVAVHEALGVHVLHGAEQLVDEAGGVALAELAHLQDVLQDVTAREVLHEEADLALRLEHGLHARHARVLEGGLDPHLVRSKQRDPNPKDSSLIGKETSTYKGFQSMFAALLSYSGVAVRVRAPLCLLPTSFVRSDICLRRILLML